ncbi:MAG: hypothetical protein J6I46_07000 [Ruminococcus sp.]|nr:hypothetical protein [Ruminococcus sp.]MBQ1432313.1 hypothetical protein [Ruminococcus sp.]
MKKLYHYTPMLILTILASIALIATEMIAFGKNIVFNPDYYVWMITKSGADTALYNDITEYFTQLSAPTGIPEEVYNNSIDEHNVSVTAKQLTKTSLEYTFGKSNTKPEINYDYTQLEKDITEYIEKYSDANGIEKDSEYYSLIDQTIHTAEVKLEGSFDIMMAQKLANSSAPQSLRRIVPALDIAMIVCGVITIALIALMFYINRHHLFDMVYWIGTILFCGGGMLLIPTVFFKVTKYFDGFFLTDESLYRVATGSLYGLSDRIMMVNLVLCGFGVVLIIFAQIIHVARVRAARRLSNENDE